MYCVYVEVDIKYVIPYLAIFQPILDRQSFPISLFQNKHNTHALQS